MSDDSVSAKIGSSTIANSTEEKLKKIPIPLLSNLFSCHKNALYSPENSK